MDEILRHLSERTGEPPETLRERVVPELDRLLAALPDHMKADLPALLDSPAFADLAEEAGLGHLLRCETPRCETPRCETPAISHEQKA